MTYLYVRALGGQGGEPAVPRRRVPQSAQMLKSLTPDQILITYGSTT